MPLGRRRRLLIRGLGRLPGHAIEGPGMDASFEPRDARRDAVRPRSAPAFCQPVPVTPLPAARPTPSAPKPKLRPPAPETVAVLPKPAPPIARPERSLRHTESPSVNAAEPVRTLWATDEPAQPSNEPTPDASIGGLWTALARGVALMLGTLLAVDLFASGGLPASGPWWLDTRPLPQSLAAALLGLSAALLILFAARGTLPALVRAVAIGCLGLLVAIALKNATIYYGLLQRGDLHAGPPIAFGLHVAVCFGVVLLAICSRQRP